jgi:carbon storage regulator
MRADVARPLTQEGASMLVLSRQRDETIMIGDDIEVTVVDIRGDKVRLGITAPKEISVHRKEVYDAIRRENREAAQVKPEDLSGLGKLGPKAPRTDDKPDAGK